MTCLLCLPLASCIEQKHWVTDQIRSNHQAYGSYRLAYSSHDPTHGIDVQMLHINGLTQVYLLVHSTPVLKQIPLKMTIEDKVHACPVYHFAGGQKFLLGSEEAAMLIEALSAQKKVILSFPGYRSIIEPENFSNELKQILQPNTPKDLIMRLFS